MRCTCTTSSLRQVEKVKTRGAVRVPKLPKVAERRLEVLAVGQWVDGVVSRLVGHGAWVDVGAQTDGFLHVRAMRVDGFVHEAADEVTPGESVQVCILPTTFSRLGQDTCSHMRCDSCRTSQIVRPSTVRWDSFTNRLVLSSVSDGSGFRYCLPIDWSPDDRLGLAFI